LNPSDKGLLQELPLAPPQPPLKVGGEVAGRQGAQVEQYRDQPCPLSHNPAIPTHLSRQWRRSIHQN